MIDIPKVYTYSFNQFKTYASFAAGIMVTYFVLAIIPQIYFIMRAPQEPTFSSQFISLMLTFLQVFLNLGFIKIMLLLIENRQTGVHDLFNNFRFFLSYFVATFLYGLAVLIGLFLLVAPGIYIAIRLQFYPYFIIEQNEHSFAALQSSFALTEGMALELFLFGLTVFFLNVLGLLFFGLGFIFTYPLTTMATAVIYKSALVSKKRIPSETYTVSGDYNQTS